MEPATQQVVPYLPYTTFKNFLLELKSKGKLPPRIDASVMVGKSGEVQAQLRSALRFFEFASGSGTSLEVHGDLDAVVDALGTDQWAPCAKYLLQRYDAIVAGIDVTTATQKQLEDRFQENGNVSGSSQVDKATRFYLQLAGDAGLKLSSYFKKLRQSEGRVRSSNGRKRKSGSFGAVAPPVVQIVDPANGLKLKPLPDSAFSVFLPDDITEEETRFALEHVVKYLQLRRNWFAEGFTA